MTDPGSRPTDPARFREFYETQARNLSTYNYPFGAGEGPLRAIPISSGPLRPDKLECVAVAPSPGDSFWAPYALVRGLRLFHPPREVILECVETDDVKIPGCPIDAAAYCLDAVPLGLPPLPLEDSRGLPRGEPFRFVALDCGVISAPVRPLRIHARAYAEAEPEHGWPSLEGYLVVEHAHQRGLPRVPIHRGGPYR